MKMPSSTINKIVEAKASTDLGDAAKQCLMCLEKKVRNLEKRKGRIEQNREKASKGTKLEKEAELSLTQYEQVTHDLEFAKELHKQFLSINSEHEKIVKKQSKREKVERQSAEIKRVSEILQLQSTLDLLGGNEVREDFKTGKHGAVVLTEDNLDQLDKLYQAISPSRDDSGDDYPQRLNVAADHMVNILDGKDRQVLGTTYKELKELLTLINGCGYFERANHVKDKDEEVVVEAPEEEEEEEEEEEAEETSGDVGLGSPLDSVESTPEPQQQPIDLTVGPTDGAQSQMEIPPQQQPMNTMEQDAFFAPSSTPAYQEDSESQYSPVYRNAQPVSTNFESFTNNRPFQFIQTSYVMPESQQAPAPSVVDPAVIHAQPAAGGSGLAFMSQGGFDATAQNAPSQTLSQQPQAPVQPNSSVNNLAMADLSQGEPHQQQPSVQPPQPQSQQPPQSAQPDYTSQAFAQQSLQQNMAPEGLFSGPAGVVEEVANSLTSHSGIMGQMREDNSASPYEIPPSIPMPPSQTQDELDQQQQAEKKFQMNASAPVFQSMYAQVAGSAGQTVPVTVPPPSVPVVNSDIQAGPQPGDFNNANVSGGGDFQQGYQGNNGFNNGYSRGGRGGFRGSRGGGPPNGNNRNGGPPMQNGFSNRGGANQNNSRGGGGRGGGTFQGYPPNANYRPDSFQGNYNAGGFNKFPNNRGGMNNTSGGPGQTAGYQPRGGPGGNAGRGGMRGMSRGGSGGPRGGGGGRGGFSRPPPNQ